MSCERVDGELLITFADVSAEQFIDPFADWTIERCRPPVWRERICAAGQERLAFDARRPSGLIFHIARCGSTLATQMMAECPGLTAYSEPNVLNDLLYPHPGGMPPSNSEIRALIALLGAHAGRPFVIKCRSWHSLFMTRIVQAMNGIPWAFLHRDPVEVAVSVLRKPPTWLRSRTLNHNPFQPFTNASTQISDDEYVARMLGAFFTNTPSLGDHGALIAYETLPSSAISLASTFGIRVTAADRDAMLTRARFYSKRGISIFDPFASDVEEKWKSASPELVAAIGRFARPQLEALINTASVAA